MFQLACRIDRDRLSPPLHTGIFFLMEKQKNEKTIKKSPDLGTPPHTHTHFPLTASPEQELFLQHENDSLIIFSFIVLLCILCTFDSLLCPLEQWLQCLNCIT